VPLLFTLLSEPSLPIRLATSVALLRIVSKGLKEPGDKLQLIKVLSLGQVIDSLESKTKIRQTERGEDADEGEESYREALAKLLNVLGLELANLAYVRQRARYVESPADSYCRTAPTLVLPQKHLRCYIKFFLCFCDSWRTNTMIHAQLSFRYCKRSLAV
jgi:hypothetical protein